MVGKIRENKVWAVSAVAGFVIVVIIMLIDIYVGNMPVTGAAVAENVVSNSRTAGVIVISLLVISLTWFIYSKLKK